MGQINPDLPEVGGDIGTWGNILNAALDEVIAQGNATDLARVETNVKSFGASTASADNRVAIQAALNAATPGEVVVIPPGGTFNIGFDPATGNALLIKTGVTLRIDGRLRVKNAAPDWQSIFALETGATVAGYGTVDCNPVGNPLAGSPAPQTRMVARNIGAATGGLMVRDIKVYGHVGHNAIYFSNTVELTDVSVVGVRFEATGLGTTAATAHDHSTLYLEARRIQAIRNTFVGATPYGAHAAIETHGSSQIVSQNTVDDYVLFGNLTGVQVEDGDNVIWMNNIGRRVMIGIALYVTDTLGGVSPGLRNVSIGFNQFTIDRDFFLPFQPEMGAPVPYGVGLYSGEADLTIQNLTISYNHFTFEPFSTATAVDEFNAAGVDLWRVTPNSTPDKNIRIEHNTIVNSPSAGVRFAGSNTEQLVIRDNLIVDPGGSVSSTIAPAFRTGVIVTGGSHKNLTVSANTIIDSRAVHKITSLVDVSLITAVAGGRVIGNTGRVADGTYVPEVLTPNGAGKQFYIEAEQPGPWQGFWTSCAPGSKIRVASTGDTYVNATTADGAAPSWIRQQAGRVIVKPSDLVTAAGPVGSITKKIPVYDETGLTVVGYLPVYTTIT